MGENYTRVVHRKSVFVEGDLVDLPDGEPGADLICTKGIRWQRTYS